MHIIYGTNTGCVESAVDCIRYFLEIENRVYYGIRETRFLFLTDTYQKSSNAFDFLSKLDIFRADQRGQSIWFTNNCRLDVSAIRRDTDDWARFGGAMYHGLIVDRDAEFELNRLKYMMSRVRA